MGRKLASSFCTSERKPNKKLGEEYVDRDGEGGGGIDNLITKRKQTEKYSIDISIIWEAETAFYAKD